MTDDVRRMLVSRTRARLGVFGMLVLLGVVWTAVPASSQAWQGREEMRDSVTWVLNPAEPASPSVVIAAKELWRAGGDSDTELLFGVISQITTDKQGNVYLLDSQLNQVMVFSPNGEPVRAIGREGEGPGEFQRPSDLFLTADGNVAVMQRMPGRIVLLTPEGEPIGNLRVPEPPDGGMQMFSSGRLAGENVVLNVSRFARREDGFDTITTLFSVDRSGNLVSTFFEKRDQGNFANMVFDEKKLGIGVLVWNAGGDGRVYTSDQFDRYRYQVWSPAGNLERVVEREYTSRKRSNEEMKRYAPVVRIQQGDRAQSPEVKASETDRDIQQIFPRDNGDVWVLSSKGAFSAPSGAVASFDVFDNSGKFTGQITFTGKGTYSEDGLYVAGNRLYVVTGFRSARRAMFGGSEGAAGDADEAAPMEVICYELGANAAAAK